MWIQHVRFEADGERLAATVYRPEGQSRASLLSLHGAGSADRSRVAYICQALAIDGVESLTFDFSGHGESTGRLKESSLKRRVSQAIAAAELFTDKPDILLGTSMGGHIALQLLPYLSRASRLILFCPALYSDGAFDLPFDERFSQEIRKIHGYEKSSALDNLRRFSGRTLVLIGERDIVIPRRVVDLYMSAAPAPKGQKLVLSQVDHLIHSWASASPLNSSLIISSIREFLESS